MLARLCRLRDWMGEVRRRCALQGTVYEWVSAAESRGPVEATAARKRVRAESQARLAGGRRGFERLDEAGSLRTQIDGYQPWKCDGWRLVVAGSSCRCSRVQGDAVSRERLEVE